MTQALLSELAHVKALFQLRAIALHIGIEPAGAPHALLVGDTGEGKPSRPSVAVCTSSTIATGEGTGGLHSQRTIAPPHMAMEPVTHRDLSQHADSGITHRNEIVPVHGSFNR